MTAPDVQPLAWDSSWLGFAVARVGGKGLTNLAQVQAAIAQCQATGVRLLYLVFDPSHQAAARAAEAAGAQLVDEKLTYHQALTGQVLALPHPPGTRLVRAHAITPTLEELAVQSGAYSRFREDARFGTAAFESLYRQWLWQTFDHGLLWVAETNTQATGLLAFAGRDNFASIELLAVAPDTRRQGIGQCLVQTAKQAAQQQGYSELRVVTQAANQPACRLYEQCGFRLLQAELVYHLWL